MKKCLSLLLFLLLLVGCAPGEARIQLFAMDTAMTLAAHGPGADQGLAAAQKELFRLDALLSRTRAGSDVARLNAAAGSGESVALDPDTAALLRESLVFSQSTGGAFDPAIAPVMDAWGFGGGDGYRVPHQSELDVLLPLTDPQRLTVDPVLPQAALGLPGMEVDLGGVAKGYAADRTTAILKETGVASALLDLGSSTVSALGVRPDGKPWRIGVKNPETQEGYLCVVSLRDQILSTSGAYERFFEEDGVRYHHILDPKTGRPSESDLLSATVVSQNGALTDALSTALFVAGSERALELWRGREDFELLLVRADRTILATEGLDVSFEGGDDTYEIIRR